MFLKKTSTFCHVTLCNPKIVSVHYLRVKYAALRTRIVMGDIKLVRCIGRGGYGEVHYGMWNHQHVAIKQFFLGDDYMDTINQEIDLIKNLSNRYIIQFYAVEKYNGRIVMITDYAENGNLSTYLRKNHPSWDTRSDIIDGILRGMIYLHSQNVIHCDLKTLNILMDKHNTPKLCDFGLSRVKVHSKSVTGMIKGTVRWMAPELFSGKPHSFATDIFALGIVLWEICANGNQIPYETFVDDTIVIVNVREGYRDEIPKETPDTLRSTITACWHQDPSSRPKASELIQQPSSTVKSYDVVTDLSIKFTDSVTMASNPNNESLNLYNRAFFNELAGRLDQAFNMYKQAADMGDDVSMYTVGLFHQAGRGGAEKNIHKAIEYFEKAKTGLAYNALGAIYHNGTDGIPRDYKKAMTLYMKGCDGGVGASMRNVGILHRFGLGTPVNYEEAIKWFRKAVEKNAVSASYELGIMYRDGLGVTKNSKMALYWFQQAAEKNHAGSILETGLAYHDMKQFKPAYEWYLKGAQMNDPVCMCNLSVLYKNGLYVAQDFNKAYEWCAKSAQLGSSYGMLYLGDLYLTGKGVPMDKQKAQEWYIKSAENGNSTATNAIGAVYFAEKNYKDAMTWYTKSAALGDVKSMHTIGYMYHYGLGVPLNYTTAHEWYKKGVDKKYGVSMNNLAILYRDGLGVTRDYAKAYQLFKEASENGSMMAMFNLGDAYVYGEGVEKNFEEAHKWYLRGAEKGDVPSMRKVSEMYRDGKGVPQNDEEALKWFERANSAVSLI